jgi:hypothetical protein
MIPGVFFAYSLNSIRLYRECQKKAEQQIVAWKVELKRREQYDMFMLN